MVRACLIDGKRGFCLVLYRSRSGLVWCERALRISGDGLGASAASQVRDAKDDVGLSFEPTEHRPTDFHQTLLMQCELPIFSTILCTTLTSFAAIRTFQRRKSHFSLLSLYFVATHVLHESVSELHTPARQLAGYLSNWLSLLSCLAQLTTSQMPGCLHIIHALRNRQSSATISRCHLSTNPLLTVGNPQPHCPYRIALHRSMTYHHLLLVARILTGQHAILSAIANTPTRFDSPYVVAHCCLPMSHPNAIPVPMQSEPILLQVHSLTRILWIRIPPLLRTSLTGCAVIHITIRNP